MEEDSGDDVTEQMGWATTTVSTLTEATKELCLAWQQRTILADFDTATGVIKELNEILVHSAVTDKPARVRAWQGGGGVVHGIT